MRREYPRIEHLAGLPRQVTPRPLRPLFFGWGICSPAYICPQGYVTACSAEYGRRSKAGGWSTARMQFDIEPGETVLGCCPESYTCGDYNGVGICTLVAGATLTGSERITVPTARCEGTDMVGTETMATFPSDVIHVGSWAIVPGRPETSTRVIAVVDVLPTLRDDGERGGAKQEEQSRRSKAGGADGNGLWSTKSELPGHGVSNKTPGAVSPYPYTDGSISSPAYSHGHHQNLYMPAPPTELAANGEAVAPVELYVPGMEERPTTATTMIDGTNVEHQQAQSKQFINFPAKVIAVRHVEISALWAAMGRTKEDHHPRSFSESDERPP
ncbi:hypothetical protein QBC37DRAFT_394075 [Rhypophila decipiens]|uniref:Uncharacterized protein n=1 Tax=Rhypophila decipiens TaxID=261697 RepID=A0AAN6YJ85_9PEZI|nr:hypothetical protein QBC37DRAFT_394075 [Rhypophila decipiens]